jgi:pimeloyl-ACP methyl ester carboxylesterase
MLNKQIIGLMGLFLILLLTSCSARRYWSDHNELGLSPNANIIFVPYDETNGENFALYFFTLTPFVKGNPTVLFCAGGPGQVVDPDESFLKLFSDRKIMPATEQYNVVYFHLRGSANSQFPPLNTYDRHLRTRLAVRDIERIREKLGIDRWQAIVGLSYGSVLAQQYAGMYGRGGSEGKDRVGKLVLVAPMSLHEVRSVPEADNLIKAMTEIQLDTLKKIYTYGLKDLSEYGDLIAQEVGKVIERVSLKFDNMQFVIDEYDRLVRFGGRNLLQETDLEYSLPFFTALRALRRSGWLRYDGFQNDIQDSIGLIVVRELSSKVEKLKKFANWEPATLKYQEAIDRITGMTARSSDRVYNVMSIYDGLDVGFLKIWLDQGQSQFRRALRRSAGEVHSELCGMPVFVEPCPDEVNPHIEKVGISTDKISRWDPAIYSHRVPTLILKGTADPVSTGDEREYIYYEALRGSRSQIKFPGLGHPVPDLILPRIIQSTPLAKEGPCLGRAQGKAFLHSTVKECLIYSFVKLEFDEYKTAPVLAALRAVFKVHLDEMGAGSNHKMDILHCPPDCASLFLGAAARK